MLIVVLVLVFSHYIGYYDNQIDKNSMVIGWLESWFECTVIVSYIKIVELLTHH